MPPVRHTSAGHGAWQTVQRDVVRLSSSSVSLKDVVGKFILRIVAAEGAAKARKRQANDNHDWCEQYRERNTRPFGLRESASERHAAEDAADNAADQTDDRADAIVRRI